MTNPESTTRSKRWGTIVAVVMASVIPAASIAQSTTDCRMTAIGWTCDSGPSGSAQFATGMSALANALNQRKRYKEMSAQFNTALQDGDCEFARNLAVAAGSNINDLRLVSKCFPKSARVEIAQSVHAGNCAHAQALASQYEMSAEDRNFVSACVPKAEPTTTAVTEPVSSVMAEVSRAVKEGRCKEAKDLALEAGRLDLADQALRLCTPAYKK